ncbi:unnamed protein product, partial [Mesorhabditis belari]|uniref:Peptidase S1 domain-containing protein n=1 Tax=Mesorhabditis belari TaxID=2138241 RepID=A0AAF3EH22_9BILA
MDLLNVLELFFYLIFLEEEPKRDFECGKVNVEPASWTFGPRNLKIKQGEDAKDLSYPYFVRVEHVDDDTNELTNCGGSYIAPGWVLTAASCVRKNVQWYYYLKYRYVRDNKFEVQGPQQIARVWNDGDVALLKLDSDINTDDDLGKRVCLRARPLMMKQPMIAFGMGDGERTQVQEAVLRVDCLDDEETFCGRGKATTRGDSGGPLVAKFGDLWYQVGIISDSSTLAYTKATPITRKLCDWLNKETETTIC